MFFILSEPLVPPLITRVLTHSWVWSLEIPKWAKIFSSVICLSCVSADHFKWSGVVLPASPPASDPVFVVALAQKWSRHCFLLSLSLSQHLSGPCSPSHSSDAQIKLSSSYTVLQKEQRDQSSSHCILSESLQGLFISGCTAGGVFHLLLIGGGFFSRQVKMSVYRAGGVVRLSGSPGAFIFCLGTCCRSRCM